MPLSSSSSSSSPSSSSPASAASGLGDLLARAPGGVTPGIFVRRRVRATQAYSVAAASIPSSAAYGTGFSVADASELVLYACVLSGTGSSPSMTTLKVYLQMLDPQTGLWLDHPTTTSGGVALTLSGTGSQLATPATGLTNFGDLIRVGASASATSYTGGTFYVMVKDKA